MVNRLKKVLLIGPVFVIIILFFSGCTNLTLKELEPKYTYIQSYPGGGGIFPLSLSDQVSINGNISVQLIADQALNAQLSTSVFSNTTPVGELTIRPSETITKGNYRIYLISTDANIPKSRVLEVEIFEIDHNEPGTYIIDKRNALLSWLENTHAEYEHISNQTWFAYRTYVEILVVEHWTFLSPEYELRICCHIATEPNNWSKMMIRPRGNIEPTLAAHQEYDGSTYEINISEYPIIYGY